MKEKSKVKIALQIFVFAGIVVTAIAKIATSLINADASKDNTNININIQNGTLISTSDVVSNDEVNESDIFTNISSDLSLSNSSELSIATSNSASLVETTLTVENIPSEMILYSDNKYGKWGYVDQFRKEVIPHIYEQADDFIDEYAAVCKNYSYGFISKTGEVVIPFTYVCAWSFIDGLAPVYNGDKWGFIDKQGNVKIQFKFESICRRYEGSNQVYTDENDNVINYAYEVNHAQSPEAVPSAPASGSHPIFESESGSEPFSPKTIQIQGNKLERAVFATINGSELYLTISKDRVDGWNENNTFPFRCGVYLESNKTKDYAIRMEICIDSDGSVIETDLAVFLISGSSGNIKIPSDIQQAYTYLDNDKYVLQCDIENDYVPLEDLYIKTWFTVRR